MKKMTTNKIKVDTEIMVNYIYDVDEVREFLTNLIAKDFTKLIMSLTYTISFPFKFGYDVTGQMFTSFNGNSVESKIALAFNGNVVQNMTVLFKNEDLEEASNDLQKCIVSDELIDEYVKSCFDGRVFMK